MVKLRILWVEVEAFHFDDTVMWV